MSSTIELGNLAFEMSSSPLRDAGGKVIRVLGVAVEISRRIQAERTVYGCLKNAGNWPCAVADESRLSGYWNARTNEVFFSPALETNARLCGRDHELDNSNAEWDGRIHPRICFACRRELRAIYDM